MNEAVLTKAAAWPSVGQLAEPLVQALRRDAASLRVGVAEMPEGSVVIDGGSVVPGGIEAGLRIAEICMGGLGRVTLETNGLLERWPWSLTVRSANPVLACLGSQYAGWSLSHGEGDEAYFALGSGPGRALVAKEPLFEELDYRDSSESAVFVLEVDKPPPAGLRAKMLQDCGLPPERLTLILTPTRSLAGCVQIVARVLEVALHKLHELGFPLDRVVDGVGSAPLPPPAPDFTAAMGRTNDAIIYGGWVQLFVSGPEDEAEDLAQRLPSSASHHYGHPFAETFKAVKGDFYAIDPSLFSPARVTVTALESGRSFHAGALDPALIDRSFS
ncbi:MAG: methenyltetrahydromethanopterin cyclohydrolase [Kiloniellales bacterium]|nr:methenyltetrahydromethanopterin cyclohydrolase [Kiloniellales bacterium]